MDNQITLLMVTHDRYFLDRVCNRIIELENNELFSYTGNYSYYLEKRSDNFDALFIRHNAPLNPPLEGENTLGIY